MASLTCAREPLRLRGAGLLPAAARRELRLEALHALHRLRQPGRRIRLGRRGVLRRGRVGRRVRARRFGGVVQLRAAREQLGLGDRARVLLGLQLAQDGGAQDPVQLLGLRQAALPARRELDAEPRAQWTRQRLGLQLLWARC